MSIELQRFHNWARRHGIRSRVVARESLGKGIGLFLAHAEKNALQNGKAPASDSASQEERRQGQEDSQQGQQQKQDGDSNRVVPLLHVPRHLLLSKSRVFALTGCEPLQKTYEMLGGYSNVTERLSLLLFLIYERLAVQERNRKEALRCERLVAKVRAAAAAIENDTLLKEINNDDSDDGDDDDDDGDDEEGGGKDSLFGSYVGVLPDISTPVTLTAEVVQGYLAGTLLLDSVCAKRSRLEAEYENLSGARGIFEHWKIHPTLEDYIWADATFWSRVLSFQSQRDEERGGENGANGSSAEEDSASEMQDDMHMVPFLDFANHATKPNIRWYVDPLGLYVLPLEQEEDEEDDHHRIENTSHSVPVQIPVTTTTDKPTLHALKETHEELFLSYGDKPNMELLFLYGFMLSNNPIRFQTMAMPMDEEDPYYIPKAHALMRMKLLPRVTLYLDTKVAPPNLIQVCAGIWLTEESRDLLWIYALNEEDGVGAVLEEPELMLCKVHDSANDDEVEDVDLGDEDETGRYLLTINGIKIETRKELHAIVPTLEIYPVLVLRLMVLLSQRLEFYVSRITSSGDRVSKTEGVEIVRAIQYGIIPTAPASPNVSPASSGAGDGKSGAVTPCHPPASSPAVAKIRLEPTSRLGYALTGGGDSPSHHPHQHHVAVCPCTDPVAIEQDDNDDPMIHHQREVEAQVSTLVQIMKAYRHEELENLIEMSDRLGEGQVNYLENNTAVQEYLARMQAEDPPAN